MALKEHLMNSKFYPLSCGHRNISFRRNKIRTEVQRERTKVKVGDN